MAGFGFSIRPKIHPPSLSAAGPGASGATPPAIQPAAVFLMINRTIELPAMTAKFFPHLIYSFFFFFLKHLSIKKECFRC
jgi:hypothetical protein